jgi:hypothetical protein
VAVMASASAATSPVVYRGALDMLRRILGHSDRAPVRKGLGLAIAPWTICRDIPRSQPGESFRAWWRGRRDSS